MPTWPGGVARVGHILQQQQRAGAGKELDQLAQRADVAGRGAGEWSGVDVCGATRKPDQRPGLQVLAQADLP